MCAMLNRDGSVSVCVVNRHTEPTPLKLKLDLKHIEKQQPMRVYEYDSRNVCMNEFGDLQEPSAILAFKNVGEIEYTLLPESFTVLTTDYKTRKEPVFAENVVREGDTLTWDSVNDPEHCYYRIYRGGTADFKPSLENQIASTVDTSLDFSARYLDDAAIMNVKGDYYKVLSVNKKG